VITPLFTVWCDTDGCPEWEANEPTKKEAWEAARRRGWTRKGGKHLCPDCGGGRPLPPPPLPPGVQEVDVFEILRRGREQDAQGGS
jgi:hypothetical protein